MYNSGLNSRNIIALLEENGFKGSVVTINRIDELKSRLEGLYSQNLLDVKFFEERLKIFDFDLSDVMPDAKSIIIATTVQPIIQAAFYYHDTKHRLIVPPTYRYFTDISAYKLLANTLEAEGYLLKGIQLPEKPLLAMSGLGKYGRNNIVFVDGMGSFHRPVIFITNAELDEIYWGDMKVHDQCLKCKACIKACPTNAIAEDKFLINAERCLTYFNEGSNPFPEWINSGWHNCMIGCMKCQNICPINKKYSGNIDDDIIFSEQETSQILMGTSITDLSRVTIDKLKQVGLYDDYNVLSRNLDVLINRIN